MQHLEVLNELTALQKLRMCLKAADMADKYGRVPNCTLSGKRFAWKLPKLDHLALCCLEAGTIVLSCPKLAEISLARTESLRVEIKDAALESLVLCECCHFQFALECPETQLHSLKRLKVADCIEEGRHVIQDVSLMTNLRKLFYCDFLAERMPLSFPQSLEEITLYSPNWSRDVPRGLKDLHELKSFGLDSSQRPWEFTVPLATLLPVDSLEIVSVGCESYHRRDKAKWRELEDCLGMKKTLIYKEDLEKSLIGLF